MESFAQAIVLILIIYSLSLLLHVLLPSRVVEGYVCDSKTGQVLIYRLNGPIVFIVIVLAASHLAGRYPTLGKCLALNWPAVVLITNILGILGSLFFVWFRLPSGYVESLPRCLTKDQTLESVSHTKSGTDQRETAQAPNPNLLNPNSTLP